MPYDLSRFSPQAFEQFIQALCIKIIGPGTAIFGSGRDGGREASFEGKIDFPSPAENWDGYTVIQAKCKEKPNNDARDATWLAQQLVAEFESFLDRGKNRRAPQFYIVATNVHLSSVPKSGGRAKVEAVFEKYRKRLKLRSFAIWSATELSAYLDNDEAVRTSYAAWVTSSDVLAALLDKLQRPDLDRVLPLALSRDLRHERDVRLRDAGQETEKPIFLDDAFVDLPIVTEKPLNALARHRRSPSDHRDALAELMRRAGDKLDPKTIAVSREEAKKGVQGPLPNRIVILGGPGQGKSTLSQFLAQLARARLLETQPDASIQPQSRSIVDPVIQRAVAEGVSVDGPLRYPIRIDLPAFADALETAEADQDSLSLIAFMSKRLARDTDCDLQVDDFRLWLASYPVIVILDGLDEVPPSSNRISVIRAIDGFWDDLHGVNCDAITVVTTRPQGYSGDLNPEFWEHWELAPLSPERALHFARRLSNIRLSDPERRATILNEIERAANDSATQLLLISPLQVTIMFGIALLRGAIPHDRWELFERYYTLLRDREAQKPGVTAALFRDYKRQIDSLHYEAGFLLQVTSEAAGGSIPYLTEQQFRGIVERALRTEDYDDGQISEISGKLVRVATERLVLLATRVEGRIAFDVRSLQEFMAAAQLTAASATSLSQRLRTIAFSAHWRHVFRIAASRIFSVAELGHYRDDVLAICHSLDAGDFGEIGRVARAGATLALDLLTDGVAASTPKYKKQLTRRALAVLDAGPSGVDERLLGQFADDVQLIWIEEISDRIRQGETLAAVAAWSVLFQLLQVAPAVARDRILSNWPTSPQFALRMLALTEPKYWTREIVSRARESQIAAGPKEVIAFANRITIDDSDPESDDHSTGEFPQECLVIPLSLFDSNRHHRSRESSITLLGEPTAPKLAVYYPKLQVPVAEVPDDIPQTSVWQSFRTLADFISRPSRSSLSHAIGSCFDFIDWHLTLPWPLQSVLEDIREGADFAEAAKRASEGYFGDHPDWVRAEARWAKTALAATDLETWNSGYYLQDSIATKGAPYFYSFSSAGPAKELTRDRTELLAAIEALAQPSKQLRPLEALLFSLKPSRPDDDEHRKLLRQAIATARAVSDHAVRRLVYFCIRGLDSPWTSSDFVAMADRAGRIPGPVWMFDVEPHGVITAFSAAPERRGLLSYIAATLCEARTDKYRGLLGELPASAFSDHPGDSETVAAAVALLRMMSSSWSHKDAESFARSIATASSFAFPAFGFAIRSGKIPHEKISPVLTSLWGKLKQEDDFANLGGLLDFVFELQPSPFSRRGFLQEMGLPTLPDLTSRSHPG